MPSKSRPADTAALVSEEAIRDRAYHLWEQAGRPEGTGDHYWHLAHQEVTAAMVERASAGVARATKGAKSKNPQELPASVKASKATKARVKEGETGKPKAKAKPAAKPAKKASTKPRAAVQKPK